MHLKRSQVNKNTSTKNMYDLITIHQHLPTSDLYGPSLGGQFPFQKHPKTTIEAVDFSIFFTK